MRLHNKTIIVTGATGGIGQEIVRKLLNEGANVALVDLNAACLDVLVTELNVEPSRILVLCADAAKELEVRASVSQVLERFGRVDGLVNNAGVEGPVKNIENISESDFDFVYGINVKGAFYYLKYVMPIMKSQCAGAVVNMSSIAGLSGSAKMMLYISSKHALMGINKVAALEGAEFNVRVNAVNPGSINTQMMRKIEAQMSPDSAPDAQRKYQEAIPMKRYGEPWEVANVVAFLLSDEASYVSSSSYTVDGALFNV